MEESFKILCVEDDKDIREAISDILRDEGFIVIEAQDGKDGFKAFIENKPDLIISDIMMPSVDGYTFLKMVRDSKYKNNMIPFIFLSALGQKEKVVKGIDMSANDYLVKPIDFDILIAKIKEKLSNSQKINQIQVQNIDNIKNQVSHALPSEISSYLDSVISILQNLKQEPYGPYVHRRYLEDINRAYIESLKIKNVINESLDPFIIEKKLNVDEEIFSITNFLDNIVNNIPINVKDKIFYERSISKESNQLIKIDKKVLFEIIRIFIGSVIKIPNAKMKISLTYDVNENLVLIFYFEKDVGLDTVKYVIDEEKIQQLSVVVNCDFSIFNRSSAVYATLTIPNFRLIKK